MAKIVGIDPGLADTGIGIVTGSGLHVTGYAFGCIHTSKYHSLPVRLDRIYTHLNELLNKEEPDLIVVEDIFSLPRNPKSAISLGKVTGVILLAGNHAKVSVIEIPVREAKKVLSGNGNADKIQLEQSVRYLLNHPKPIRPYHASDALALALIGLYRYDSPSFDA